MRQADPRLRSAHLATEARHVVTRGGMNVRLSAGEGLPATEGVARDFRAPGDMADVVSLIDNRGEWASLTTA